MTNQKFALITSEMDSDKFNDLNEKVRESLQGQYHLEFDGYYEGDATEEDVISDAVELGIETDRDYDEVLEDVLRKLDENYINLVEETEIKKYWIDKVIIFNNDETMRGFNLIIEGDNARIEVPAESPGDDENLYEEEINLSEEIFTATYDDLDRTPVHVQDGELVGEER